MAGDAIHRKLYQLLRQAYRDHAAFTKDKLKEEMEWSEATVATYFSKQFKGLLAKEPDGSYRVTDTFLRYPTFERFKELVTQVRRVAEDYTRYQFSSVVVYDFFMPLSNEDYLRRALDALFFKDTLMDKLRRLLLAGGMEEQFSRNEGETDDDYLERILDWVDSKFGGYSILQVNGRFKVPPLLTAAEAGELYTEGGRYLVDETTAVVRFICPCGEAQELTTAFPSANAGMDEEAARAEANRFDWFFWRLFVDSIVRVVNGQDEIWMLESGMRSRLYVWKVSSSSQR